MRTLILAALFALSATPSLAQGGSEPAAPAVAPGAPLAGGVANLCQELLAFMKAPPPEPEAKQAPAAADKSASAQPAGAKPSETRKGTTPSGDPAKVEAGTGSAQKITGQEGVATDAPQPAKDNAASGSATNAPQKESRAAPLPPADVTSTPKESVITIEAAEKIASANDIAQCQKTARKMRVAGVAMPPPLIALTALDMQFQQKSGAQGAAPQPPQ